VTFSPFAIGKLKIASPLVLAPIADFTHAAFRELVAEIGGCGLFYTEMLNSRMVAGQSLDNDPYIAIGEKAAPVIAQLIGNDPDKMAESARKLVDHGFHGIDINCGCSRHRIRRFGWGVTLMEDHEQLARVVSAVRRVTPLPLLAKLRSGMQHDTEKLLRCGKLLEDLGVDAICLHPRSSADGFKRPSRWEEIAGLVEHVSIPVIGNGDVFDGSDCRRMLQLTGCAAVMIGRGALVRPWMFHEIIDDTRWSGDPLAVIRRYVALLQHYVPQELVRKRFVQFCNWFSRNWPFHRQLCAVISKQKEIPVMLDVLRDYLERPDCVMVDRPFLGRL